MIDLFHSWDDDGSGDVTLAEFQRALQAMGMAPAPYQVAIYLRYIALYLPYISPTSPYHGHDARALPGRRP